MAVFNVVLIVCRCVWCIELIARIIIFAIAKHNLNIVDFMVMVMVMVL